MALLRGKTLARRGQQLRGQVTIDPLKRMLKPMIGLALMLALVSPALAHRGAPYWSKAEAEHALRTGPIQLEGRLVRVKEASCYGNGSIRLKVRGVYKYQHFYCLVIPSRDRTFWVHFHPLPRSAWAYNFVNFG